MICIKYFCGCSLTGGLSSIGGPLITYTVYGDIVTIVQLLRLCQRLCIKSKMQSYTCIYLVQRRDNYLLMISHTIIRSYLGAIRITYCVMSMSQNYPMHLQLLQRRNNIVCKNDVMSHTHSQPSLSVVLETMSTHMSQNQPINQLLQRYV